MTSNVVEGKWIRAQVVQGEWVNTLLNKQLEHQIKEMLNKTDLRCMLSYLIKVFKEAIKCWYQFNSCNLTSKN